MIEGLGVFAEGVSSWAKVLASGTDKTARIVIFASAAADIAGYTSRGLSKPLAVDALQELAVLHGLVADFGDDVIQAHIAQAFEDLENVPPLMDDGEPRPKPKLKPNGNGNGNGHSHGTTLPATSPFPIVGSLLSRRPWEVPGLLMRKQVTLLVAPPGSGKSLLTLQLAMICGAGISEWAGWKPRGRYRTLVINVEEDEEEMKRRLFGACEIMGLDQKELVDRIYLADTPSIVVAKADSRTKTVTATPMMEKIVATIIELKIDLVVVDPFAETFQGDENSNSELKWAAVLWREVARKTGCAVLLVHHARKYSGSMAGDPDAGRGGGALTGVARIVATLFPMTDQEFDLYRKGIKKQYPRADRSRFIRFDDAKANHNLMTPAARWFYKETIGVGNAGDGIPEDEVGVLKPWKVPDFFDDLNIEKINYLLDEIDIGTRDDEGQPTGDPYGPTKKGNSKRWVGDLIQESLQISAADAKKLIDRWLETGLLVEYQAKTKTSKGVVRDCLKVDGTKRPGTLVEEVFL